MRGAAPTLARPGAGTATSPPKDAAGAADVPDTAAPLVSSRDVCPYYHEAVELLGKRWTGAIVHVLLPGPMRFSEIAQAIPQISDRLLSMRLKELESFGIIAPPRLGRGAGAGRVRADAQGPWPSARRSRSCAAGRASGCRPPGAPE